ncbi:Mitogen-activated protein kinase 7 [Linum perenne]
MATMVDPPNGLKQRGKHYYSMWQTLFEIDTKYVPIKPVGRGAYGIVCSSINRETNEKVAIKKINNVFDNKTDALRTLRELKLLRHVRHHQNVIALKDVMVPAHRLSFRDVYLVYELMDTDLNQIIRSSQALSDDHCRYFVFQLLRGLSYLHSANILHRDLKPGNLLVNANCDLKDANLQFIGNSKARHYIKSLSRSRGVGFSHLYPRADPQAIDLLQRMLVFDPTKRITVDEALRHPYMSGLYDPRRDVPAARACVDLDVDENVGEDVIREMMWDEMILYHHE